MWGNIYFSQLVKILYMASKQRIKQFLFFSWKLRTYGFGEMSTTPTTVGLFAIPGINRANYALRPF